MLVTQMLSQRAYGGILEHFNHRNLDSQSLTHLTLRLHQQQRMSAQTEEVVIDTDLLYFENFLPDVCDGALHRRARSDVGFVCVSACAVSLRERAPVNFTV